MDKNKITNFIKKFKKYQKIRIQFTKNYYTSLLKATLLLSIVPIIVLLILLVYDRLSPVEGVFAILAVIYGSSFFAKPYLADLSSLTHYVKQLASDKKAKTPPLSFLGNMNELSARVSDLQTSWNEKKHRLEEALAESRILFDTLPDIILILDEKLNIVRANNVAFIKLNKVIIEKRITETVSDKNLTRIIKAVLNDGKGDSVEVSVNSHNIIRDYKIMVERFPINIKGSIAIILVMHDITESKRTKQMMKDFVANASHEIRTPLTSVIGFIETLQTVGKEDEKVREKFLNIISEQTAHIAKLVNDLLSLSKAEINEDKFPDTKVDISKIISSAISRTDWMAKEKNVEILCKIDKELPLIIGDPDEITQVFINLISNAIKYGPKDSKVEVFSKIKSSRIDKSENHLFITVKDYGEGIDEEHLPRITERFYRVDKVRSRRIGGTGIGLAIVKHILNRHRSNLYIESTLNEGSEFTVDFPIPNE